MSFRESPPDPVRRSPAFFAVFDAIAIVNRIDRPDRRHDMVRLLERYGLADDPRVRFFPAVVSQQSVPFRRAGSHGAFLSHLTLLREAAEKTQTILILQDDCEFLPNEIEAYKPPANWDIFYGGYIASNPENPQDSDIIGAHFMGFSPRAAEVATDYLTRYLQPDFPPDQQAAVQPGFDPAIRPPIDGAFVWMRRAHPELVTVFKMLGVQRSSRTDIGDSKIFDRIPVVRSIAERARRIRAALRPGTVRNATFGAVNKTAR